MTYCFHIFPPIPRADFHTFPIQGQSLVCWHCKPVGLLGRRKAADSEETTAVMQFYSLDIFCNSTDFLRKFQKSRFKLASILPSQLSLDAHRESVALRRDVMQCPYRQTHILVQHPFVFGIDVTMEHICIENLRSQ